MMPWNKEVECMPVEKIQKFQLEKLRETVEWVSKKIPFYKQKFKEAGIKSADIKSLEDVAKLPFTVKTDLRDNYPFGLCGVPLKEVVRVHASSGTTGKPITGPYTQEDLDQWTECMVRNFWAAGVRADDIVQNAYGYGLFTGGLGFHQAATKLGCTTVPTSSGLTERQITIMRDFGSTVLCATPSYALTIAERAEELKVDLKALPLRVGIFGAEPWTTQMRDEIEERMGIKAMEAFGLTELGGPGVAYDCEEQNGLHINEDYYLAEIVDPATMEPLPLGEKGELIFTSLQRRAMPMIRYRTKDITSLTREKCACGRTFMKMNKVYGRTDDMLIISGVNVFPSQIESLLLDIAEVEPQYRLIVRKKGYLDQLAVQVEAKKEI
ncbi:MAG: phenylacetate--CoA ligase, partial [Deltaproteobacteria bacterium]